MFKKKCNKYPLNIIQEINLILNRSTGKTEQCQGKGSQHEQSQMRTISLKRQQDVEFKHQQQQQEPEFTSKRIITITKQRN